MAAFNDYCMFISVIGIFLLLWLWYLILIDSDMMKIHPKNKWDAEVALFVSAFLYLLIFAINYYFKNYAQRDKDYSYDKMKQMAGSMRREFEMEPTEKFIQ